MPFSVTLRLFLSREKPAHLAPAANMAHNADPTVTPILIPQTIDELHRVTVQIRRKLQTLVSYYIYPDTVPNEIEAYDPRLVILQLRVRDLSTFSYSHLTQLVDESDSLAAQYLSLIVGQLFSAVQGIKYIFESHYDPGLAERETFATILETLTFRDQQLRHIMQIQPNNPRRVRPEDLRPNEPGAFCRGALQMINHRDRGKVSLVDRKEFTEENRKKLKDIGGAFLFWQCPECTFKLRFHVASSINSNIHQTDEVRDHRHVGLEYRSSFLCKSHLFLPNSERGSRGSTSSPMKYGCVFCFATGRDLVRDATAFSTGLDLATHIDQEHRSPLPPSLMLHHFLVVVDGKLGAGRARWDVNFK